MAKLAELIAVARGLAPADLILANARIVNVFNGEIERGNVAIFGGQIAGIGDYRMAKKVLDLQGGYVAPGLVNGHTHIESSMLDIGQYASAVVPHGTLGIVTDLHEMANVSGIKGIRYILNASRRLPFELFVMAPSCVPATHLETSGAVIDTQSLRQVLKWRGVVGIGEMMNYPGVLFGDKTVLDKIRLAQNRQIDGHAPGLGGYDLNAYATAGISSDHESVTLSEAREKLARGMYIMIREGSSEKNLEALLPLVTDETYRRCLLVVDDRSCADLESDGDIDAVVRKAIKLGLPPVRAIQLASINAAERFGLQQLGAVAPGYLANLIVLQDLQRFKIVMVFHRGRLVARDGGPLFKPGNTNDQKPLDTVRVKPFGIESLRLKAKRGDFPVIEVVPGQIITHKSIKKVVLDSNGFVMPDVRHDILKLVVVERHKASGNIGKGLVKGFGLEKGALASSIAHDSHNIVAVGASDADIYAAVKEIIRLQGGLAVVCGGKVLVSLALPVAGLLSDAPLNDVVVSFKKLEEAARELGTKLADPFATLSFIALPVIPELRLTDLGLVDVNTFKIIET